MSKNVKDIKIDEPEKAVDPTPVKTKLDPKKVKEKPRMVWTHHPEKGLIQVPEKPKEN